MIQVASCPQDYLLWQQTMYAQKWSIVNAWTYVASNEDTELSRKQHIADVSAINYVYVP